MAKSKTVDLKPKTDKITKEQLTKLQEMISMINKIKFEICSIEATKHNLLHTLTKESDKVIEIQEEFQEQYGTFDINIQDGTINYKDEQTNKKN